MENRITQIREQKNMTQEELSEKSGVSRAIISGLESGRVKNTTTQTLKKIALALDSSIAAVFFTQ